MNAAAIKRMALNFSKLDKFEGVDFRRWQKKMQFLLSSMSVVYVLTTPILEDGGHDANMEQIRKRDKWDNDDYVCTSLILNEDKYMADSSKKFLVSNFTNYKMTDSRPVMKQYNELLDFKHTLKHLKEELTLVELDSHLHIEESLRMQDSDKPKVNDVVGPLIVNMVEHNNSSKYNDNKELDKFKYSKLKLNYNKGPRSKYLGLIGETKRKPNMNYHRVWGCRAVVKLSDPKLKTLGERGIECIFVGYAENSKAFRFYVIEPNNLVLINSIMELMDDIFDENRFSSVPRPSQRYLINGTKDIGCLVVLEDVTEEADKFIYSKFNETGKGVIICLYVDDMLIFDTDQVQVDRTKKFLSSKFSIMDIRKADVILVSTLMDISEKLMPNNGQAVSQLEYSRVIGYLMYAMTYTSPDIAFDVGKLSSKFNETGKGVIICLYVDDMLIFDTDQVQVDRTKKFLSSKFSIMDIRKADVILVSTLMDISEKLMPNNGQAVSQLEYSRVIGYLMYAMTYTSPDIAFDVGKLSRYTNSHVLEAYTDASWISNIEDNSSTSGWIFLLGGSSISWASKK
nr:hypothetical protein [Tanacetum cinerariifolium]